MASADKTPGQAEKIAGIVGFGPTGPSLRQ
jgi:hypothetical protein